MKELLKDWFVKNNHPRYYKYFDMWFDNLTQNQLFYFEAQLKGNLSPYAIVNEY